MEKYDLVVAGAGPAGMTLAWKASEAGLDVLVFDKKKDHSDIAYETSASFIDLDYWGLPDSIVHPLNRCRFSSENEFLERDGISCVIKRRKLLGELEKRCLKNNVAIKYGTSADEISTKDSIIESITLSDHEKITSKIFADCTGATGLFNKKMEIPHPKRIQVLGLEYVVPLKSEPQKAEIVMGSSVMGGYGWLFPIASDKAIVGVGLLKKSYFPQIRDTLENLIRERFLGRIDSKPLMTHSGIFTTGYPQKNFNKGNLMLVGDVAAQGNPAAGEGVRYVMEAAEMAAKSAVKAIEKKDLGELDGYSRSWSKKYHRIYQMNYAIQKGLIWASERDWALDHVIKASNKASTETITCFMKGEADIGFIIKKIPKLFYKPLSSRKK